MLCKIAGEVSLLGPRGPLHFDHWEDMYLFLALVEKSPLVPVGAIGTNKAGLKPPAFSPGCLRTGTKRPPHGPGHVLRLEDL
jgi:hypothetical protein